MEISLKRIGSPYHFEAVNANGNKVSIDAAAEIGGTNSGARPMELFIMGLGGCSGIDVVNILNKQKQEISDFQINIQAERNIKDGDTSLFSDIHIEFVLKGKISEDKLEKAIALSLEKYCSAAKTLEKTAKITSSWKLEKED